MLKNSVKSSEKEQLPEKPGDVDVVSIRVDVRAVEFAAVLLRNVEVGDSTSLEFCESSTIVEFPLMIPVSKSRFKSTAYLLATRLRSLAEPDELTGLLFFGSRPV